MTLRARGHPTLSIRRQCRLLALARSGVDRPGRIANDDELAIMRRRDELFLAWPFFGSRRMKAMLRADGRVVNRKRVRRLMRRIGLRTLGPKPLLSHRGRVKWLGSTACVVQCDHHNRLCRKGEPSRGAL